MMNQEQWQTNSTTLNYFENIKQKDYKIQDPEKQNILSQVLTLKVKNQDGQELAFRIKKNIQMKKLIDVYCKRQGLDPRHARFVFDGERIQQNMTPKELSMENNDVIDALFEQSGGCFNYN